MSRPERLQRIVLLERTLTDYDFQPKTATGAAIARNTKAEAHEGNEETILCRGCRGKGKHCGTCRGSGVEVVDQYTKRRLTTEGQKGEAKPQRMVRCDACGGLGTGPWWRNGDELDNTCRRCWGAKVVPGPSHPIRPFRGFAQPRADAPELRAGDPVLACMERRQEAGSYDELGLSLAALRLEYRPLYRLNVRVLVDAAVEEDALRAEQALRLEASLRYLAALMPAEIRVPSWAARFEERRRERVTSERNGNEVAA